jgi:hypothetical protein
VKKVQDDVWRGIGECLVRIEKFRTSEDDKARGVLRRTNTQSYDRGRKPVFEVSPGG